MGGRALGGGAGFSISGCSGVRERYIDSRESLAEVWRDEGVLTESAADLRGGSGVFKLIVV